MMLVIYNMLGTGITVRLQLVTTQQREEFHRRVSFYLQYSLVYIVLCLIETLLAFYLCQLQTY